MRKQKSSFGSRKRLISILFLFIGIFLLGNLAQGIFDAWRGRERIQKMKQDLQEIAKENETLQQEVQYYQSEEFVEKEAREKLNLVKPGETVIIVPEEALRKEESERIKQSLAEPVWRQWTAVLLERN
ncbi:MAG TPA: septum formation initiator family protein [Patescibacteria group bacterium]|nr:septum formation initiator family protein [Patescibacteria group bacterium]